MLPNPTQNERKMDKELQEKIKREAELYASEYDDYVWVLKMTDFRRHLADFAIKIIEKYGSDKKATKEML